MRRTQPIRCNWKKNGCLELIKEYKGRCGIKRSENRYGIHQWVFLINNGYLPNLIMHTCDNARCVNPLHLKAGTFKKNSEDMVNKKRQAFGEKNGGGKKLTEKQVKEIKKLIPKLSLNKIANKFGVSKKLILLIKQKRRWKYLERNENERKTRK